MKLLFCNYCGDVFNLSMKEKTCGCGRVGGRYLDDRLHAEYWGDCAYPLGFSNPEFQTALAYQPEDGYRGEEFVAFVIPEKCDTMKKIEKGDLNNA